MERSEYQRPEQRPRSKSAFSFRSDKSHSSKTSEKKHHKEHLKETYAEKRKIHISQTTKANPNAAMNEAQPVAAALERPTLGSLRAVQHVDANGNPIVEPDLSNPTRSRWERPLDTIRSFEAAIEGHYKRQSILRADISPGEFGSGVGSRRSSYYGGPDQHPSARYSYNSGYYGSRAARDNYGENFGVPMAGPSRNRFGQRLQSEPAIPKNPAPPVNSYATPYPQPAYHNSRDTVNTGVSNGSQSEPWANSTEPSSENSSIERRTLGVNPENPEYNFIGFGGASQLPNLQQQENGDHVMPPYRQPNGAGPAVKGGYFQQTRNGPPPPPPKRVPTKLTGATQPLSASSGNAPPARPSLQANPSVRRKSWFGRRFGKK